MVEQREAEHWVMVIRLIAGHKRERAALDPSLGNAIDGLIAAVRGARDQEWLNEMSRQITPVEGQPGMAMTELIHKTLAARMGYEQRRKEWKKRDA